MATASVDPDKRHKSRYPGITYRVSARDPKARTYHVYHRGRFVPAGKTEKEALAKQGELRAAQGRGEAPVLPNKTTFSELAESWFEAKARHLRPRTRDYYRNALDLVLLPRFGNWKIAAISPDAIAKLVRDLERDGLQAIDASRAKRPLGRSSIDNYLKPLQGVLALAQRRRLIGSNPFSVLTSDERPKRQQKAAPHFWTTEELTALIAAAEQIAAKPESRHDYTPLLKLAAATGLRVGEILGLQWKDFDSAAGYLHVRRQWLRTGEYGDCKTKAGSRDIPLSPDLKKLLLECKAASPFKGDDDPIFASRTGTPLSHRNVTRRGFEAARDRAGLPDPLTFHDLRHAAASRLIDAGLDAVTVAAVLGHENPSVTLNIYAAPFNRQRKDEAVRAALAGSSPSS